MTNKVWFITGASKGFGLELTKAALESGYSVVATAREPRVVENAVGKHEKLLTVELDVTKEEKATKAVEAALAKFGQIDVLVNNAGRGIVGAVEEVSIEEIRASVAVNVEGVVNVTRAVLPAMRKRRKGTILNISSVGGFVSWPGWGIYCGTKFMLEGISESLRSELEPLGIKVTIVEPGPFRTDFLASSSLQRSKTTIADYADSSGAARDWADSNHDAQEGDPVKAVKAMIKVAELDNPPVRLPLGKMTVDLIEEKLRQVQKEVDEWREVAIDTAFSA
jgi:NADP-dependent 3-hydroxy acid dehydrogenase YdfG